MDRLKINATAKKHEILCAALLSRYIFPQETLFVGDDGATRLPDIYTDNKRLGIEAVQMENAVDLDIKYIGKAMEDNKGDFAAVQRFCNEKYKNLYDLTEFEGKVACITDNLGSHSRDWMKCTYRQESYKKLSKLNKGNYSGIHGEMDLCVTMTARRKSVYDANLLTYEYMLCKVDVPKTFDKIFIVTTDCIFVVKPNNITEITPIVGHNCIVDFSIQGNDYLEEVPIDYNATAKTVFRLLRCP